VSTASEPGTLFLIVGPSGVGKDSLIDGLRTRLAAESFLFARRVITRPADAGGEAHEACSLEQFDARERAGGFLISWRAHGLGYGLPAGLGEALAAGRHVIANGSRGAVVSLAARVSRLVVVEIDAPADLLASRLVQRARESAQDIEQRLVRPRSPYPEHLPVLRVCNDSRLDIGISRLEAAVRTHLDESAAAGRSAGIGDSVTAGPEAADAGDMTAAATAAATPSEAAAVAARIAGRRLDAARFGLALSAIVDGRIDGADRDAFLIACANDLDDDELLAVARWRTGLMPRIQWDAPLVVDKHSLGGTAGSRVTMVVIPIVAAHGLVIPKTSSRAITSASGTADAMEVLARVDLSPADVRECVAKARACIAWNGRLNHSLLDEAMHRIERPMRLDTRRWSVASILSKKWSAGATHVVIDIPYSPQGKVRDPGAARALGDVFESLGTRLGLTVRAYATDASAPIGRGIGPALEARDVMQVLNGHPDAPADLRAKSLFFASRIIALDPAIGGDLGRAEQRAAALLDQGAAREAFDRIVSSQGRKAWPDESRLSERLVRAPRTARVAGIHAQTISMIARHAGAPADPLAGVDLIRHPGDQVAAGEVLYRIQGLDEAALEAAAALAGQGGGYELA
jgi:thymidine phosphorylase